MQVTLNTAVRDLLARHRFEDLAALAAEVESVLPEFLSLAADVRKQHLEWLATWAIPRWRIFKDDMPALSNATFRAQLRRLQKAYDEALRASLAVGGEAGIWIGRVSEAAPPSRPDLFANVSVPSLSHVNQVLVQYMDWIQTILEIIPERSRSGPRERGLDRFITDLCSFYQSVTGHAPDLSEMRGGGLGFVKAIVDLAGGEARDKSTLRRSMQRVLPTLKPAAT